MEYRKRSIRIICSVNNCLICYIVVSQVLRDNTKITYDWSYIVAWAGVGSCLLAAILLSGAAVCLRSEREKEEQLNLQYLMPGKEMIQIQSKFYILNFYFIILKNIYTL